MAEGRRKKIVQLITPIMLQMLHEHRRKSWNNVVSCVCVWVCVLHRTASFNGKLSGLTWVLCATTQLMSFPLSAAVGTMRYSLLTVTVLSVPGLETVVALPLAVVTQEIFAAGRPSTDSQRATTTGLVPASTVTMEAEF